MEGNCSINERVVKAEVLGAAGVVFYNNKDEEFFSLDCDIECEIYPEIPSTLISYENGIEIVDALSFYSDDILISVLVFLIYYFNYFNYFILKLF